MAKKQVKSQGPDGVTLLKQDLKSGQYGRLYFFYGEEHYLRDYYLQQLKKKLLDGPAEEFNYHRFTQENMSLEQLADAVEAMPMMAEHSMIQVDDYDLNKLSEGDRNTLTGILSDIPDYCTVVFLYDTVELKVDGRYKKLKEAVDQGVKVEFARQSQRELTSWIRRHFRTYGKDISDKACEYLTFVTGGTMTALGGEISKIASYASGDVVTEQDINAVVIPVLDASIFDLTDAIAEGDYDKALVKLHTILQMQEEPIPVLGAIGGQMRRLLYARAAMQAGKGEQGVAELLKAASGRAPHPYVLQKTIQTARRLSDQFCKRSMELLLEADRQLKGFGGDPQRILELLLLRMAQEVRNG